MSTQAQPIKVITGHTSTLIAKEKTKIRKMKTRREKVKTNKKRTAMIG